MSTKLIALGTLSVGVGYLIYRSVSGKDAPAVSHDDDDKVDHLSPTGCQHWEENKILSGVGGNDASEVNIYVQNHLSYRDGSDYSKAVTNLAQIKTDVAKTVAKFKHDCTDGLYKDPRYLHASDAHKKDMDEIVNCSSKPVQYDDKDGKVGVFQYDHNDKRLDDPKDAAGQAYRKQFEKNKSKFRAEVLKYIKERPSGATAADIDAIMGYVEEADSSWWASDVGEGTTLDSYARMAAWQGKKDAAAYRKKHGGK